MNNQPELPSILEELRLKTTLMSAMGSEHHVQQAVQEFRNALATSPELPDAEKPAFLATYLAGVASAFPHNTRFRLQLAMEAVAGLEQQANQGDPSADLRLADALNTLGNVLHSTGDPGRAGAVHLRALELYVAMEQAGLDHADERIAGSMYSYARCLLALGRLEEALHSLYAMRDTQHRLAAGGDKRHRLNLANTLDLIPRILRQLGRLEQAFRAHQESISYGESLVGNGDDADFQVMVAHACDHYGLALQTGHPSDALAWHQRALRTYEELREAGLVDVTRDLAVCLDFTGTTLYRLNRYPESIQALQRSLELLDTEPLVRNPETEMLRAGTLDHLGGAFQAIGDLEAAAKLHGSAYEIYARWVGAGHREREVDLAISASFLGSVELLRERYDEARVRLTEGVVLLKPWVTERFMYSRERELALTWARLILCLQRMGRYASAENELWRALDVVPQRDEIFDAGTQFYAALVRADDAQLAAGGLPRDEVLQGVVDFYRRIAPYHAPTWHAASARARHIRSTGGSLQSAVSLLSEAAARWGESEPQAYLELGTFLFESGMYGSAYEAAVSGLDGFQRQLERERTGPRRRSDEDVGSGLSLVLAGFQLTRLITSSDGSSEPTRLERAWNLERRLRMVDPWEPLLTEVQRTEVAQLRRWLETGYAADLKAIAALQQLYEHNFEVLLEDRWREVRDQLRALSGRVAAGELAPDDAEREAGEITAPLAYSSEVRRHRQQSRMEVIRRVGVDPDAAAPELQTLVTAIALWNLLQLDVDSPKAVLSLVGTAVEGALKVRVFLPYRAAVHAGTAQPTGLKGSFETFLKKMDDKLMLGTMCEAWHLLVTARPETCDPRITGLLEWMRGGWPNVSSLHDPQLDTLDAVRRLRNRGPHFGEPATADDVREIFHYILTGPAPLLPRLYQALSA